MLRLGGEKGNNSWEHITDLFNEEGVKHRTPYRSRAAVSAKYNQLIQAASGRGIITEQDTERD